MDLRAFYLGRSVPIKLVCNEDARSNLDTSINCQEADLLTSTGIIGLVVEFVVAIDEARVRFTDDAQLFPF